MFLASSSRWAIDRSPATFTFDIFLLISFGLSSLATTPSAATYRILVLSINGKSHAYAMVAIAGELADRGHHVTIVVGESMPLDAPEAAIARHPRVVVERYKDGTDEHEAVYENITSMAIADRTDLREMLPMITNMATNMCRRLIFENEPLFERLAATSFNLAIVDGVMFTKCVYLIPHRLRIPVVTYTGLIDPLTVRVPWLPSFVPGLLTGFSDHMSFVQRLGNAATMFAFWMFNPADGGCGNVVDEFRRRHGPVAGGLNALAAQSLIWLVATDHVIDYPKPSMPNVVVNVGGLTVGRSAGHLPPDIQSFVSGARRGAVVVTFGSMVSRLPASIVRKFLDSFRRLDNDGLRFVWRLNASDVDVGDEFPENVIVRWWLPQNDLLAHPSVRLFITHCGNNGQYEAVYHGVPMIGFPLMGDQRHNAQRLVRKGFGVAMDLHRFDVDELVANIRAVAGGDRRYADRVRRASEIFRSAPETPVERAAYWVEHVARFGGEHLRSGGQELPLYAYLMLDVMAVVLLVVAVLAYCVYRLMRLVYGVVRLVGQSAPCAVKLMVKMAFGQYDEKRVGGWMASEDFSPKIVNDALL